ncbi:hypothetical protein EYF80_023735 [Liparis tanakae]|uniref:Uncharacterized protein n=1 Tax=Liparis tanakae TaxID=230148 RepID=A0A4Z2HJ90_9TELE|nr:hypothetical protein EYF80_023735 [Liparis tanakae]
MVSLEHVDAEITTAEILQRQEPMLEPQGRTRPATRLADPNKPPQFPADGGREEEWAESQQGHGKVGSRHVSTAVHLQAAAGNAPLIIAIFSAYTQKHRSRKRVEAVNAVRRWEEWNTGQDPYTEPQGAWRPSVPY